MIKCVSRRNILTRSRDKSSGVESRRFQSLCWYYRISYSVNISLSYNPGSVNECLTFVLIDLVASDFHENYNY